MKADWKSPSPGLLKPSRYNSTVSDSGDILGEILRDYLYLDVDKVKSIAGQLESGVPEESRLTHKDDSRTTIGWKGVFGYTPGSGEEAYVQRSMLDSYFRSLRHFLRKDG
jgi:hypothetical protein